MNGKSYSEVDLLESLTMWQWQGREYFHLALEYILVMACGRLIFTEMLHMVGNHFFYLTPCPCCILTLMHADNCGLNKRVFPFPAITTSALTNEKNHCNLRHINTLAEVFSTWVKNSSSSHGSYVWSQFEKALKSLSLLSFGLQLILN